MKPSSEGKMALGVGGKEAVVGGTVVQTLDKLGSSTEVRELL